MQLGYRAEAAKHNLACFEPAGVCMQMALEAVTAAHQLVTGVHTLGLCVRPLLIAGFSPAAADRAMEVDEAPGVSERVRTCPLESSAILDNHTPTLITKRFCFPLLAYLLSAGHCEICLFGMLVDLDVCFTWSEVVGAC